MRNVLAVSLLALAVAACGGAKGNNGQNAAAPAANGQTNSSAAAAPANTQAVTPAAGGITPQDIKAMVERDGAAKTVRTLNEGGTEAAPSRLSIAMRGIATGEQAWLDIVPLIRSGTDGETGEGLYMALADALPKNAAGVLRAAGSPDDVESACDPLSHETMTPERRTYVQSAITAVEAVSDTALQASKTSCLTRLRAALTAS